MRLTRARPWSILFPCPKILRTRVRNRCARAPAGLPEHACITREVNVARAYVKISVAAGKEREVRDMLRERPEVASADLTSGDQDIIALVQADSFDELLDLTLNQLRTIEGVTGTVTNLVVDKDDDR